MTDMAVDDSLVVSAEWRAVGAELSASVAANYAEAWAVRAERSEGPYLVELETPTGPLHGCHKGDVREARRFAAQFAFDHAQPITDITITNRFGKAVLVFTRGN